MGHFATIEPGQFTTTHLLLFPKGHGMMPQDLAPKLPYQLNLEKRARANVCAYALLDSMNQEGGKHLSVDENNPTKKRDGRPRYDEAYDPLPTRT